MFKKILVITCMISNLHGMHIQQVRNTNVTVPNANVANMKSRIDKLADDVLFLQEAILSLQNLHRDSHLILFRQMQFLCKAMNDVHAAVREAKDSHKIVNLEDVGPIFHQDFLEDFESLSEIFPDEAV